LLLAQQGKLSLDDNVRKYLPELPDYGTPITIRHMLNHTSGLRDWGVLVELAGWPRGTRVYSQELVLDIAARQRRLNFLPGSAISYTNTGYNLAAMIVARVTGQSFQAFTRDHLFVPLGMSNSRWRDDYSAVVHRRAVGYSRDDDGYHADMPFENAYGNGGLLTTIADLLAWNSNLAQPKPEFEGVFTALQTLGKLNDGRPTRYGLGVFERTVGGVPIVYHGGVTAGYRSELDYYPTRRLSVANPSLLSAKVADLVTPSILLADNYILAPAEMAERIGLYREASGRVIRIGEKGGKLALLNAVFWTTSRTAAVDAVGRAVEFLPSGEVLLSDTLGNVTRYAKVTASPPDAPAPAELAGVYTNTEADTRWIVTVKDGKATLRLRADLTVPLVPVYHDTYDAGSSLLIFKRDGKGRVTGLTSASSRVWQLDFDKANALRSARR
jgi:CubicO group peptidase (beta-lactamase class C family)